MTHPDAIPRELPRPLAWLDQNWPFAGTVAAAFLLVVLTLVLRTWPPALGLVYALLLAYLVHQMEEHYGDRFRRDINATLAGGADALTPRATTTINVGGVWGVYALTLILAGLVDGGFGLVAVYTTLVNALAHVGAAVVERRSNPGLWTALGLFGPLAALGWRVVGAASGLGWVGHVLGLGVALLFHAAIIRHVRRRARALGTR
ncbi:hypothetical protein tb265_47000 [Gemmatimonadetes bacterium T265]|nr:hypothetical protein tb265_47000 [Gemmatimonadetes bacterium T265]